MAVKIKITTEIVDDDGLEGTFYRDGERWLRDQNGVEYRLLTLAPHLEAEYVMGVLLTKDLVASLLKPPTKEGK